MEDFISYLDGRWCYWCSRALHVGGMQPVAQTEDDTAVLLLDSSDDGMTVRGSSMCFECWTDIIFCPMLDRPECPRL